MLTIAAAQAFLIDLAGKKESARRIEKVFENERFRFYGRL